MPTTRFGLEGYGVRRSGSFAGKAAAPIPLEKPDRPRYEPEPAPDFSAPEEVMRYLLNEYRRLAGYVQQLADGHMDISYAPPEKPRKGLMKYADGVYWDPGSGEGVYVYDGATWVQL